MEKMEMSNNESLVRGIEKQANGEWLAITFSASKTFKTENGAKKWMERRMR